MFPDISYFKYIKSLEICLDKDLSEKLLKDIIGLDLTKPNIDLMTRKLEIQFNALSEINTKYSLLLMEV